MPDPTGFRHSLWLLAICLSLAISSASPGLAAGRKLALVIANSDYETLPGLRNAANDGRLMAATLEGIGFDVLGGTELSREQETHVIHQFMSEISGASDVSIALVYYAGHGIQLGGDNYLLATDSALADAADIPRQATSATGILRAMAGANKGVSILILDACRDNPFKQGDAALRSVSPGLAPIEAVNGTFVAYATAPGFVAYDGEGRNSPFTSALAEYMTLPGLNIEAIMRLVGTRVRAATADQQVPWSSSSLTREFVPLRPRLTDFRHVETKGFDENRSYFVVNRVLDDLTLVCGATLMMPAQAEFLAKPLALDEVRRFFSADHYTVFHVVQRYGIPYHCQLYCGADKAAYCRDVEVLETVFQEGFASLDRTPPR